MAEKEESRNLGAGGAAPKIDEGTRMPTYAPLFRLQHYIYTVGNFRLWRELTVIQLLGGLATWAVVFFLTGVVIDGMYAFFLAVAAGVGVVKLIAVSDDLGRNPLLELRALLVFTFSHPRYFVGARPVKRGSNEEKRLKAMIARERSLAGPAERTAFQILRQNLTETYRSIRRGGV